MAPQKLIIRLLMISEYTRKWMILWIHWKLGNPSIENNRLNLKRVMRDSEKCNFPQSAVPDIVYSYFLIIYGVSSPNEPLIGIKP